MQYRTLADLSALVRHSIHQIPHDIDLVVGIPRSGLLPANMIALFLNKKLTDIDSFVEGKVLGAGERQQYIKDSSIHKVLVVDDSVCTGNAMLKAKNKLQSLNQFEFIYCAPIVTSAGKELVDIYFEIIDDDRIFEWNVFHHGILKSACVDIDGVLNLDPEEDDDGPIYVDFLKNAVPLFVPTIPIGTFISCRLEKYREYTEQWLETYGVTYEHLELLPFATKAERVAWGQHGRYKGDYYAKSNSCLFIESSKEQAEIIAKISHKPVLCIETNTLLHIKEPQTLLKRIRRYTRRHYPEVYIKLKRLYYKIKGKKM